MLAMKCDRCGKFYEYYSGKNFFQSQGGSNTVRLIDAEMGVSNRSGLSYDLCPQCMGELLNFMKVVIEDAIANMPKEATQSSECEIEIQQSNRWLETV